MHNKMDSFDHTLLVFWAGMLSDLFAAYVVGGRVGMDSTWGRPTIHLTPPHPTPDHRGEGGGPYPWVGEKG